MGLGEEGVADWLGSAAGPPVHAAATSGTASDASARVIDRNPILAGWYRRTGGRP
jgi:hypothetical protein